MASQTLQTIQREVNVNIFNIPAELRALPNWVGFTEDKVPMNCITKGERARTNDKATWTTFEQALTVYKDFGYAGIGFVFEPPLCGVDLDDCVVDGRPNEFSMGIINQLNSYTEYSPSGTGVHIICKGDIKESLKRPEIEIYPNGRYFTFTGKTIIRHSVISDRTKELQELIDRFKPIAHCSIGWIKPALENMQNGNRDITLFRLASSMWTRGYKYDEIYQMLLPHAQRVGFPEKDLEAKILSTAKYPRIGNTDEDLKTEGPEVLLADQTQFDWVIKPFFPKGMICFVAGIGESGKSWLLLDLAIEAARGGDWLGTFPVAPQKVLYIDQERSRIETTRRVKQLFKAKNLEVLPDLEFLLESRIKLNLDRSFEAFKRRLQDGRYSLVLVDSFVKLHDADENSRMALQIVFDRLKQLRNELGITFVLLEHEGKNVLGPDKLNQEPNAYDMTGSASKAQEAESVLTVKVKGAKMSTVFHTKSTCGTKADPFKFEIRDEIPEVSTEVRVI